MKDLCNKQWVLSKVTSKRLSKHGIQHVQNKKKQKQSYLHHRKDVWYNVGTKGRGCRTPHLLGNCCTILCKAVHATFYLVIIIIILKASTHEHTNTGKSEGNAM